MSIRVLKFGGTSLGSAEAIGHAAGRIAAVRDHGFTPIVVVSAMGHETDRLIDLAQTINPEINARELDFLLSTGELVSASLMAAALDALNVPAIALTGEQAGIHTDGPHGSARIAAVETRRLRTEIQSGRVPVVAGFQGVNGVGDVATLGRGGSDITAVAIAAALDAEVCEIITDVDGVFTADPRLAPDARRLEQVDYTEMLEWASQGAAVIHARAVRIAQRRGLPLRVLPHTGDSPGTWIQGQADCLDGARLTGCALRERMARLTLSAAASPAAATAALADLARGEIEIESADVSGELGGQVRLTITLHESAVVAATATLRDAIADPEARIQVRDRLAAVSLIGSGLRSDARVVGRVTSVLADAGIEIVGLTVDERRVTGIVGAADGVRALHRLHALLKPADTTVPMASSEARRRATA